jgi:hypothetical protein
MVLAVPEHVEEDPEDAVLHLAVPGRRQRLEGILHGGDLAVAIFPRGQDRQEKIGAGARHVTPPGGPLLVQRHRKAVGPEEVQRDVAHQLIAAGVGALLHAVQDVRARRRLHGEVASDYLVELLETVHDRQVQLWDEVGWKHDPVMTVDDEWLHVTSFSWRQAEMVHGEGSGRRLIRAVGSGPA